MADNNNGTRLAALFWPVVTIAAAGMSAYYGGEIQTQRSLGIVTTEVAAISAQVASVMRWMERIDDNRFTESDGDRVVAQLTTALKDHTSLPAHGKIDVRMASVLARLSDIDRRLENIEGSLRGARWSD